MLISDNIPASLPVLTMDMVPLDSITTLPETDSFTVQLKKDTHGLGITIAGYVCEKGVFLFLFYFNCFLVYLYLMEIYFKMFRRIIWNICKKYK